MSRLTCILTAVVITSISLSIHMPAIMEILLIHITEVSSKFVYKSRNCGVTFKSSYDVRKYGT